MPETVDYSGSVKAQMFSNRSIPFHGNHDGMSCGQCVYKMILETFFPQEKWPFPIVDKICQATPGKYTWPFAPLNFLHNKGLDIQFYTTFRTEDFLNDPQAYLLTIMGEEGQKDALENSDMPATLAQAREYLSLVQAGDLHEIHQNFTPALLRELLDQGYLLAAWVDYAALNNEGMGGHLILLHDYDSKGFYTHDPGSNEEDGSPAHQYENRYLEEERLIRVCSPLEFGKTGDLIAIRLPQ